ncbi:GAF domain-containing protein [Deinococcus radiotolerans]|uniref:histidine kinase n=1 Tax=Deinococcus radiotolerans TaxID=1309407 RepID=A0ABQ2FME5_9DEIO|nr:GAF domain-containing protein [Deinococcus radiotolerans]GGL07964.1 hypothetical protein GCM10010844_28360 [Deinococcus radiotolerans]
MSVPHHSAAAHALAYLASVPTTSPHPTWTVTLGGELVTANAALQDYLGLSLDDLRQGQLIAATYPEDRAQLRQGDMDQPRRLRLRRHDGQYRWFQMRGLALMDAEGQQGWLVAGVDIQPAPDAAETADLTQLQMIVDGSSDCIKVLDLEGQLLSMNAGGMSVMEVDDFTTCRLAYWPSFWEGDLRAVVERAVQGARAGRTASFEGPARTMKGRLRHWEVTVSPVHAPDGQVRRLLAVSRDITQRQRQQSLLTRQAELLERVVTDTPTPVLLGELARLIEDHTGDLSCRILRVDAGHLHLITPSPGEPLGLQAEPSGWEAAALLGTPVTATDQPDDEVWAAHQDWAAPRGLRAVHTRPVFGPNGAVQGVIGVYGREVRPLSADEEQVLTVAVRLTQLLFTRERSAALLGEQADTLRTLSGVHEVVSAELNLGQLMQAVIDAGVNLTGAQFGTFSYTTVNDRQDREILSAHSGVPRGALSAFPIPRTAEFGPTFPAEGVIHVADLTGDARDSRSAPDHSRPDGDLPVRSYLTVPVRSRSGELLGRLTFGHATPGVFSDRSEQLAVGLAAQTAVALDNAKLYGQLQHSHAQLERRVQERTRELEAQAASLDAFTAFTEAVGTETDVLTLARQALAVLRTRFPHDTIGYYEPEGDLWKLRAWTDDLTGDVLSALRAGLPASTPMITRTLDARTASFTDAWDATRERIDRTEVYTAVGAYPLLVDDAVQGILSIGRTGTTAWADRDRALFSAVGRGFSLALERAARTQQIEVQRDTVAARSRALEAFALLTRDLALDVDPLTLVRRAQEILMSLLPDGYTLYWQPEGGLWINRSQVGSLGHPELQLVVDAGLPRGAALTLDQCWTTEQSVFQDRYAQGADTDEAVVTHVQAAAMLPIRVNGHMHGMVGVGLFETREWTLTDKGVLDTVARSLSLALEGAESAQALKDRTQELERSNAELEKFAYVASHDLQEPLRTITSFSELVQRRYSQNLDERGRTYLNLVTQGAQRMKVLIDDLLVFSRLNAVREPHVTLPLGAPLDEALARLHAAAAESGAVVTQDELPRVTGDRSELTQLFQNLIGNAIKFRRANVPPAIHVTAERDGPGWHVTVQDNGIGFEPEYAERMFQMFQRLHLRDQFEGNGMGLAIVRKIAEHHGGRVWATSEPGQGSAFHFTLPAALE